MPNQLTYQQVYDRFRGCGFTLLTTEYINATQKLDYECKCGFKGVTSIMHLRPNRKRKGCVECRRAQISSGKLTLETVRARFREKGFKLLATEYNNADERLLFRCKCGNEDKCSIGHLKDRIGCSECGKKTR